MASAAPFDLAPADRAKSVMTDQTAAPALLIHGGTPLPSVVVDSYNVEIREQKVCAPSSKVGNMALGHRKTIRNPWPRRTLPVESAVARN